LEIISGACWRLAGTLFGKAGEAVN
jgi:hypothetical protein